MSLPSDAATACAPTNKPNATLIRTNDEAFLSILIMGFLRSHISRVANLQNPFLDALACREPIAEAHLVDKRTRAGVAIPVSALPLPFR